MQHLTTVHLEAGLADIRQSPRTVGTVELIVSRPAVDERETLDEAELHLVEGLVGDSWRVRGSIRTRDRAPDPDSQLNVINARAIALIAQDPAAGRSRATSSTSTSTSAATTSRREHGLRWAPRSSP